MLWNLTYADPDRWQEVYAISGKPSHGGSAGSPRMRLLDGPGPVSDMIEETSDVKWANLQRTQAGAILYFRVRLEVYGLPALRRDAVVHPNDARATRIAPAPRPGLGAPWIIVHAFKGFLALLNAAFGPETVSKVHA